MGKTGSTGKTAKVRASEAADVSPFRSARTVLQARSIAVVGASERGNWPVQIIKSIMSQGYKGRLDLINPRQKEVFGQRCYPSISALPQAPEHAAIIVPSPAVADILDDALAAGVKSATIYSANIGDGDDPHSKERGAWLAAFIARSGMRIAGPNCMGAFSFPERLIAYPNSTLATLPAGPVGLVFQSGGNLQFLMQSAADRGMRFSYAISSGNEPDLDLADYVNFLVEDEGTHTIMLFIEGIRRPAAFMLAAAKALEAGKPMIAIKTGQSQGSAAAAQSHTGAIAGDYAAFLAMCDRLGITVARTLDEMVEMALAFQCRRWPKGPRIGFVTTSGGTVDLLYDVVEREGATLAEFSEATKAALRPIMQDGIPPRNPLDVGLPSTNEAAAGWCRTVLADDGVDMVAYASALPRRTTGLGDMTAMKAMADETTKPVIGFGRVLHEVGDAMQASIAAMGFPYLMGLEPTVRAMNALWRFSERQGRKTPLPGAAGPSTLTRENLSETLARYGIHEPRSRLARTPAEAAELSEDMVFPQVVKIVSADILHKTEVGGVVVDLRSPETIELAAARLQSAVLARSPNARIDGFLVQEMASGIEAIVGARSDALYGPMLLVGAGGVLVEFARDTALEMLPVSESQVSAMIGKLRLAKLLDGYRGRRPADRKALEDAVLGLGQFFLDHRSAIRDIEINPLIVRPDGKGALAVDVRVIWN